MSKKYIINYFPGSLGDSLISHIFSDILYDIDSKNEKYLIKNILELKNHNSSISEIKAQIVKYEGNIISSHFLNMFLEHNELFDNNFKLIHIDPSNLEDVIARRCVTSTHIEDLDKTYKNLSEKSKIIRLTKNIIEWKQSIPSNNSIISLYELLKYKQDYFKEWKENNNLYELCIPNEKFFKHANNVLKLDL